MQMRMYRLLIVDDEPDVADGLYDIFRNVENIDLDVLKAYSAYEALDILTRVKIDILLTDILMPGMTGLQLVERVHFQWPDCRAVFLTGHNEFDYIYSAVQLDSISYLLKTESFEKIIEAVEKAAMMIESSTRFSELETKANEYATSLVPYMQKEYFSGLLNGESSTRESRELSFRELKTSLDHEMPVLLLVGKIAGWKKDITFLERSRLLFSARDIAGRFFSPVLNTVFNSPERQILVWFVQQTAPSEKGEVLSSLARSSAEVIQNACHDSLGLSISFIVDSDVTSWETLSQRYELLKILLQSYAGPESNMLLLSMDAFSSDVVPETLIDGKKIKQLEIYLESGQEEEFYGLLSELLKGLCNIKSKHNNPALEIFYSISLIFLTYINRYGLMSKAAFKIGLYKLTHVEEHDSWQDAADYFRELASILFRLRSSDEVSTAAAVDRVKQYINAHLDEDLSLSRLAERVYFNPSYLSRLFKQSTGTNLLNYINEARINKAKELLKNHNMKIHEVSNAVGYESASYFTQFFKRFARISPQEYRDSLFKK